MKHVVSNADHVSVKVLKILYIGILFVTALLE